MMAVVMVMMMAERMVGLKVELMAERMVGTRAEMTAVVMAVLLDS